MIKYRTSKFYSGKLISEVEVERETESSVWINGRRSAKKSDWHSYFDDYFEAKGFLVEMATIKLGYARDNLDKAERDLARIESLSESDL